MEAGILHSLAPSPKPSIFAFTTATSSPPLLLFRRRLRQRPLATVTDSASGGSGDGERGTPAPPAVPPDEVEVRFRRASRRRRRQPRGDEAVTVAAKERAAPPPKKWEEMSVAEKAVELYVGEKGLLFWLNKFAYASIFIVIGAWILFRFVGPALNLYQLDTPLLAPTSLLKG
ncbi:uncharacterized protein LOC115687219 [Syzygium oleosum]|uniref:uncharacterized protein LOC115687219 n=1 Tax=Syzygium oleosum TaxID=219896 RepID=UPI0011D2AEAC|nr:uncharacterized protein LOC115687219 [Syzygium oleosum]